MNASPSSAFAAVGLLALSLLGGCQAEEPRFDASGNFETTETVVAAQAQGQLLQLAVHEGDELAAGRPVGLIDTAQLYLRKRQLQASQQAVRRQTPNVSSQLGALEQQVANLQQERKRVVNLVKADAVPAKQLDDMDYQIAVARQQLAAQRSALSTQASGTSAQVEPLRVQVEQVNDQLRHSRVVNPVAGTVLTVYVEPSEVVNYGQPLYKIGDTKTLLLRAYVAGDQLTRVQLRQAVKVLVDAPGGKRREYPGRVTWISSKSEFTPKVIQTKEDRVNLVYALKIAVPNDGSLKIGMPADVLLTTSVAMPAVELSRISKSYGATAAVRDVSLTVAPGELFGLIGPDGAGKTTLFRILTTLLLADAGTATVAGHDVVRDFRAIRNVVGYMPGKFSLYQDLTVQENLAFFAAVFRTTVAENYDLVRDIYEQLAPFKDRRAGALSGGMKQKLALCCALIHKPEVLLLDEPTTGVDAVSRQEFWHMLATLKAKGITIVVSTPYMDEAALCERVALLQEGRVLRVDTPAALRSSYPWPLYAVQAARMHPLLQDLRAYPAAHSCYAFGETAHISLTQPDAEAAAHLTTYLTRRGHAEVVVTPVAATIEDTFMDLLAQQPLASSPAHEQPAP